MLIITSPSKTLDFYPVNGSHLHSQPLFLKKSAEIAEQLQKCSKKKLQSLMHISEDIAELNYYRFKHWQKRHDVSSSKPAILAYKGDIYRQFNAKSFDAKTQQYLQETLRIISGLYGALRAYDLIQPYRLEMGIKLKTKNAKDLYELWNTTLLKYFEGELGEKGILVNLASEEYAKALKNLDIGKRMYKIEFRQNDGKKIHNHGIYAKKARGMMIGFMAEHKIKSIKKLEEFNVDGYKFVSNENQELTFMKSI